MKPQKIPYLNQHRIFDRAVRFLNNEFRRQPCVKEAWIWGSLADGTFGVYQTKWRDEGGTQHSGSDIDAVIIIDETKHLPKNWKFTGVKRSWCDIYELGVFKQKTTWFRSNKHIVEGLLVFPSRHNLNEMHSVIKSKAKRIW